MEPWRNEKHMNTDNLAREASDESSAGNQELPSRARATSATDNDETGPSKTPAKSPENAPPPPPIPDHAEVLRLVAEEALGRGLAGRMF